MAKFFTKYSRPADAGFFCNTPSMTDQSQKDSCDVSSIVQRFGLNACQRLPDPSRFKDVFDIAEGGFSAVMESLDIVQKSFMTLNSDIRSKFNNDAKVFARFIATASKSDFEDLGLLVKDAAAISGAADNAVSAGKVQGIIAPDDGAVRTGETPPQDGGM